MRRLAGMALPIGLTVAIVMAGRHLGDFLVVADALPRRADAIVVLAGSPLDRTLEAASLYATGLAPRVLLTRERRPPALDALAKRGVVVAESDEVAADLLRRLGVPASAIETLPTRTDSTVSEAQVIAAWICAHGTTSVVVVTSPSHTRRARMIIRRAIGDKADLAIRPTRDAPFPSATWWRDRRAAKMVALELQKLLTFWLVDRWGVAGCPNDGDPSRRSPS